MNKKFLSAILFGALMVTSTGTFVSCKDYDDDIKDLQEQINKLATKDDMAAQIATLQAALTAAQSEAAAVKATAAEALAKATSAESNATEAEKAAAQAALDAAAAKEEAIKAAQDEVAKVKAALEASIDAKFEAEKKALAETIAKLTETVETLTGLTTEMITSIDLQAGYGDDGGRDTYYSNASLALYYNQMPSAWSVNGKDVKSITFGKDLEGALTLNANELFSKPTTFLVSVAPANAVVTADMLSLINSKNESLDAFVDLTVEKYNGLLTRSAAGTGLYAVTVNLKKNVDLKAFAKVYNGEEYTYGDNNEFTSNYKVKFAVAATKEGRTVTSTYDLYTGAYRWDEGLCDIQEESTIKSSIEAKRPLWMYANDRQNSTTINNEYCYPVAESDPFQIAVNPDCGRVLASYVTVDINNSHLSTTDKAAIKGLTVKGVDVVSQTNVFDITISGTNAKGVVVPLKVVAIGFDGYQQETVVWVKAGNKADIAQTVTYVITPNEYVDTPNAYLYGSDVQKFEVPADYTYYHLSIVDKDDDVNITGNKLTFFEDAEGKKLAVDPAKAAYAKFNGVVDLQKLKDNKVYEGTVVFFGKEGIFLSQSVIKLQKVLPTTVPAGFSVKTNQLDAAGVYNCYLVPNNWAANTANNFGTMQMSHVFNFGEVGGEHYYITFAEALKDGNKNVNNTVAGNGTLTIAEGYIDNETKHATTVIYDYGFISSEKKDNKFVTWTKEATSFSTVFYCIYNVASYKWSWATMDQMVAEFGWTAKDEALASTEFKYGEAYYFVQKSTGDKYGIDKAIFGASSKDGLYSAMLYAPYQNSLVIKPIKVMIDGAEKTVYGEVITKEGSKANEYFVVNKDGNGILYFMPTQISTESNPEGSVPSTVKMIYIDMYGHEVSVELDVTIVRR